MGNLMVRNCQIDGHYKGTGMRMQVGWGKHNPPGTHRNKHVAKVGAVSINQTAMLPIVVIKDAYHWTISQCRHRYNLHWEHSHEHCPAIVDWKNHRPNEVHVKYALGGHVKYKTLIEFWNEW